MDAGVWVRSKRFGFAERVFWVRSTQATCASAAGAGPAVIKAEEFALDPHTPGTADSEVSFIPPKQSISRITEKAVFEVLVHSISTQILSDSLPVSQLRTESNVLFLG